MNEHPTHISTSLDGLQVQNLEQLSDEEFWSYARQLARKLPSNEPSEEHLECNLNKGCYLISLKALSEVVLPPHRFALLPAMPDWMPGVVAWRGETIAVVDLDAYLSGAVVTPMTGMLLIAIHSGLPIGILVPTLGRTRAVEKEESCVLDVPLLLADVVQHIEIAASYG